MDKIRVALHPYVSFWDSVRPLDLTKLDPYSSRYIILYNGQNIEGFVFYDNPKLVIDIGLLNLQTVPVESLKEIKSTFKCFFVVSLLGSSLCDSKIAISHAETRIQSIMSNLDFSCDDPTVEIGSFVISMLWATGQPKLDKIRHNWEKQRFIARFIDFDEDDTLNLFKFNNWAPTLVRGTIQDHQRFYSAYPLLAKPTFFIKVKLVDAPTFTFFPVYAGGYLHLSFKEVGQWLWSSTVNKCRTMRTKYWLDDHNKDSIVLKELLSFLRFVKAEPKLKTTQIDIEDLAKMLPPCTRSMITGKFPKYDERSALTNIFSKSGIGVESLGKLLDDLNEKFPHSPSPLDTLKRFDYKYCYDKGYAPPYCDNLPSCMVCPFNGDKSKCIQQFQMEWPENSVNANFEYFNGPYNWPKWILFHKRLKLH